MPVAIKMRSLFFELSSILNDPRGAIISISSPTFLLQRIVEPAPFSTNFIHNSIYGKLKGGVAIE